METPEQKTARRLQATKERLPLLDKERFIADSYCSICPMSTNYNESNHIKQCTGCPKYAELNEIGDSLNEISSRAFVAPEELTWAGYQQLREREWTKKEVARHYKIGIPLVYEFEKWNNGDIPNVNPEDVEERTVIPKEFTVDKPKTKAKAKAKAKPKAAAQRGRPRKQQDPALTDEETKVLATQAQQGSEAAEEALLHHYDRLLHKTALKFKGRGFDVEELKQVASLGFIKAVRKFDPAKGFKLTTYSFPYIEGEVQNFLRDNGAVSVPRTITELVPKILKQNLLEETPEHIAEVLGVKNVSFVVDTLRFIKDGQVTSLDMPAFMKDESEGTTMKDTISSDVNGGSWFSHLVAQDAMSVLTEKERNIITLVYYNGLNKTQVGERLGCTKASVGQNEKKALQKMKEFMEEEDDMKDIKKNKEYAIELLRDTTMTIKEISEASGVPTGSLGKLSKEHRPTGVSKQNHKKSGERLAALAKKPKAVAIYGPDAITPEDLISPIETRTFENLEVEEPEEVAEEPVGVELDVEPTVAPDSDTDTYPDTRNETGPNTYEDYDDNASKSENTEAEAEPVAEFGPWSTTGSLFPERQMYLNQLASTHAGVGYGESDDPEVEGTIKETFSFDYKVSGLLVDKATALDTLGKTIKQLEALDVEKVSFKVRLND